jgi:hypothetical protein
MHCATSQKIAGYDSQWCLISGFRREVDENCALMGYYAASSGYFVPKIRDNLLVVLLEVFSDVTLPAAWF